MLRNAHSPHIGYFNFTDNGQPTSGASRWLSVIWGQHCICIHPYGKLLRHWHVVHYGFDQLFFATTMPGSLGSGWADRSMWWRLNWSVTSVKIIFGTFVNMAKDGKIQFTTIHTGILVIFMWHILAKSVFHMILPLTFLLLAQAFTHSNSQFYTLATDYKNIPSELWGPFLVLLICPNIFAWKWRWTSAWRPVGLAGVSKRQNWGHRRRRWMVIKLNGTVYGAENEHFDVKCSVHQTFLPLIIFAGVKFLQCS